MEIEISHIVRSIAGRDKGRSFVVLDTQGEYLLLADGRLRRVEKPKRKKRKHTELISVQISPIGQKILRGEKVFNSEIRKTLSPFAGTPASEDTSIGR